MSKVSSGCCRSHYHINRKTSNTLAGSALPLPPLNRSGRSSNPFQPTDRHRFGIRAVHLEYMYNYQLKYTYKSAARMHENIKLQF